MFFPFQLAHGCSSLKCVPVPRTGHGSCMACPQQDPPQGWVRTERGFQIVHRDIHHDLVPTLDIALDLVTKPLGLASVGSPELTEVTFLGCEVCQGEV